jgi:hypothetical protein
MMKIITLASLASVLALAACSQKPTPAAPAMDNTTAADNVVEPRSVGNGSVRDTGTHTVQP